MIIITLAAIAFSSGPFQGVARQTGLPKTIKFGSDPNINLLAPILLPQPAKIDVTYEQFRLDTDTRISVNPESLELGETAQEQLRPGTGLPLELTTHTGRDMIVLRLDKRLSALGPEGYRLDTTKDQVNIRAFGKAGLFYGIQTLREMLPPATLRGAPVPDLSRMLALSQFTPASVDTQESSYNIPGVHIEDKPRFAWRGAMLDVSRHFEPKWFLLRFIDLLAFHKLNVFHIHLTDDQGWRIQIKKYPKLTEVGAWHASSDLTADPTTWNTMPDGGFYTQDDLREVVAYAQKRFITVVPEIEMPGHSMAAICSYPELGNTGKQFETPPVNGASPDVLNASDNTIHFYQDVLTEVMEIFPSKFIHVGGDEVGKGPWRRNPEMQARIKALGLKDENELQSWFMRQMDAFLSAHGRRLIGWDEILEGGLAQGATVMSWRGIDGGIAAAKAGHDVVMAPNGFTYLDHYQSRDHAHEPRAIGGFLPLEKVYSYEPVPEALTPEEAKHVLGAQCQLWTEYIPDANHVEYMAFPRLCAFAEVAWSLPKFRDFSVFSARLAYHLKRLDALNVHYRPLDAEPPAGALKPSR